MIIAKESLVSIDESYTQFAFSRAVSDLRGYPALFSKYLFRMTISVESISPSSFTSPYLILLKSPV